MACSIRLLIGAKPSSTAMNSSGRGEVFSSTKLPHGPHTDTSSWVMRTRPSNRQAEKSALAARRSSRRMWKIRLRSSQGQLATENSPCTSLPSPTLARMPRVTRCPARKRRRLLRGVCRCRRITSPFSASMRRTLATMRCSGMSSGAPASSTSSTRSELSAVQLHIRTWFCAFSASENGSRKATRRAFRRPPRAPCTVRSCRCRSRSSAPGRRAMRLSAGTRNPDEELATGWLDRDVRRHDAQHSIERHHVAARRRRRQGQGQALVEQPRQGPPRRAAARRRGGRAGLPAKAQRGSVSVRCSSASSWPWANRRWASASCVGSTFAQPPGEGILADGTDLRSCPTRRGRAAARHAARHRRSPCRRRKAICPRECAFAAQRGKCRAGARRGRGSAIATWLQA